MKAFICFAMALLAAAVFKDEARAWTAAPAPIAKAATDIVKVTDLNRKHRRRGRSLFSNWCVYKCYSVPPCYHGPCLGAYGYSRLPYDEDLPFSYRYDWDASPTDNGLGFVHPYTGEPAIRAFERIY